MSQNLNEKINDVLADRQLSISAITRELKDKGFAEHRLVLTGYLRALRDLKKLQEIEVPPSKVYKRVESHEKCTDIYSMVGDQIKNLDMEVPPLLFILFPGSSRGQFFVKSFCILVSITKVLQIALNPPHAW